jgi:anti-sigma factor (TIGR02949 family)
MKDFWNKIESQSFKKVGRRNSKAIEDFRPREQAWMKGEKMKCSHVRNMISQYVDDELTPDEKKLFTSHIENCPACKEELEAIQSVHHLFAATETYPAPLGFATRVMAQLEEVEETSLSRLWHLVAGRPFFLRTVEVAFAMVIMLIGVMTGNLLIADRTPVRQTTVQESFSLDLFQATPPDSIGGVYVKLMEANNER